MFSSFLQSSRYFTRILFRSYSSKSSSDRPISARLRFHMDTYSVYGSQKVVQKAKPSKTSELSLFHVSLRKKVFENDTELLYGSSNGFHRACSIPKGTPISERKKHLRELFQIPRGHRISSYPQAYIPDKYLGLRRKK
ncbi:hypothetical protein I4U23_025237 [Adineta vaga]|nr:hypothetical protein I4U23_025237 [Adineta vaga]